jgi:hypothetical protein
MMQDPSSWVEVFNAGDDLEMELVRGLLTTNGIPVTVVAKGAKAMPMILGVSATGSYILKVPYEWQDVARDLLKAKPEMEDEE